MKTLLLFLAMLMAPAALAAPTDPTCPMYDQAEDSADTPLGHDCPCLNETDCEAQSAAEETAMMRVQDVPDFGLTLRQFADDHFVIEGESYERLRGASLEGSAEEMLQVADAIEQRTRVSFKRVALDYQPGGPALWSPRNSLSVSRVSERRLAELVPRIRSEVQRAIAAGPSPSFGDS